MTMRETIKHRYRAARYKLGWLTPAQRAARRMMRRAYRDGWADGQAHSWQGPQYGHRAPTNAPGYEDGYASGYQHARLTLLRRLAPTLGGHPPQLPAPYRPPAGREQAYDVGWRHNVTGRYLRWWRRATWGPGYADGWDDAKLDYLLPHPIWAP